MKELEEGTDVRIDFGKLAKVVARCSDVIPVAVQNADTGEVILVAYTNDVALRKAIEARTAIFWSTSRNELWAKGMTSGNQYDLIEIRVNCEQNSLLYRVRPRGGGICHTANRDGKARNCYYRRINMDTMKLENCDP